MTKKCFCILIKEEVWEMFFKEKTKAEQNHKASAEHTSEKRKCKQVDWLYCSIIPP